MQVKLVFIDTPHFEFRAVYDKAVPMIIVRADFLRAWQAHCKQCPSADTEYGRELEDDLSVIDMPLNTWLRDDAGLKI